MWFGGERSLGDGSLLPWSGRSHQPQRFAGWAGQAGSITCGNAPHLNNRTNWIASRRFNRLFGSTRGKGSCCRSLSDLKLPFHYEKPQVVWLGMLIARSRIDSAEPPTTLDQEFVVSGSNHLCLGA